MVFSFLVFLTLNKTSSQVLLTVWFAAFCIARTPVPGGAMGPHRKEKKNSTVRAGVNGRKNRASGWCISLESHIETKLCVMLLKEIYPRWHTTCFQHKCFACCTGRLRLKTSPFHSFFFLVLIRPLLNI